MALEQTILNAKSRSAGKKGVSKELRRAGSIPAVVYGKGFDPMSLTIDPLALKTAIATPHKFNTVITIKLAGQADKLVLLKDYQQHPLSRQLLHADFQEVKMDQEVIVDVPVVLTGKAIGTVDGGILNQVTRLLTVKCLPKDIPEKILADVTGLKITNSLHSDELSMPAGVKFAGRTGLTIATVAAPEAEAVAAVAEVTAEVAGAKDAKGAAAGAKDAKAAAPGKDAKAAGAKDAKAAAKK